LKNLPTAFSKKKQVLDNRKSTDSNEDPLIIREPSNEVTYSKSESALDESRSQPSLLEEAPASKSGFLWKKQAK
jgi:hypothetical protein